MLEGLEAQLAEVGATAAAAELRGLAGEDRALLLEMLMQLDTDVPGPAPPPQPQPQPQPDLEPAGRQHSAGEAPAGARAAAVAEAEARMAREVLAEMGLPAAGGAGGVAEWWSTVVEGEAGSAAQDARLAGMIDGREQPRATS